jgi:hypothetical protein
MTEAETTDAGGETEPGGSRGAGFPVMDLETAVELIHKVGEHGGAFANSAFAQYLGHTTANSGPYRSKVASLRDWGLVGTQSGRVLLTDLGKAVAKSPDPMADQALLRSAFDTCKIFKAFYDDTAKGVALKRDTLGRAAVFDHKVSAKSQEKFVAMLVDSAVTVGLATRDETGTVTFTSAAAEPDAPRHEDPDPDSALPAADEPAPARGGAGAAPRRQPAPPAESAVPVLLRQVWPTATGEVVLAVHSTDPLPASAFGLVGKVVQAAEDLAKSIGLPAVGDPAEPEGDNAS